jgi:hypothetical protein
MAAATQDNPKVTVSMIRDAIHTTLIWLEAEHRDEKSMGAELLCGIAIDNGLSLYKTFGDLVTIVPESCRIIGETSLTKYLLPMFSQNDRLSLRHAVLTGAYLVKCARTYMDDCGGETDIWILDPSGDHLSTSGTLPYINDRLAALETLSGQVMSGLFAAVREDDFENRLSHLCDRLREDYHVLGKLMP